MTGTPPTRGSIGTVEPEPDPTTERDDPSDGETAGHAAVAATLDELQHVAAALHDARYFDGFVVDHFRRQIVACAANDGAAGPRHALPQVLGVLAAVEAHARDVTPAIRRQLLEVGARAAELAGWLYRDVGDGALASHWRDRAFEWAAEAGDLAMCGYVLLRKSQAAWDSRDAVRMLTLAQAAQQPTWNVPTKVRAEAAQQEARGHAMLGEDDASVDRKLDEARQTLADNENQPASDELLTLGAHYDEALLTIQTAICYGEAGRPADAVQLYQRRLTQQHFSLRDYGYFLSLMATSLAGADDIAGAAQTGLRAHAVAAETNSTRTIGELRQLATSLAPWTTVAEVRDLREAVLVG